MERLRLRNAGVESICKAGPCTQGTPCAGRLPGLSGPKVAEPISGRALSCPLTMLHWLEVVLGFGSEVEI